jgi:GntR family transcriptional repressor for pyruvate dehydrogenase complex
MLDNADAFTRVSREFHLAITEASHNRVLVVQFISLNHISWPSHNRTLTPEVAKRVLDVHKELASLIEMRDAAGARKLMDDHVKMIRARRVSERDHPHDGCC